MTSDLNSFLSDEDDINNEDVTIHEYYMSNEMSPNGYSNAT
jgi:hypothetical protein